MDGSRPHGDVLPLTAVNYQVADGVATVTLSRPTLTISVKDALLTALRQASDDAGVRAVVLTGSGKAFCVGQDLGEHAQALQTDHTSAFATVREHYNPIVLTMTQMPKPVIAAINGTCVGAGLGFALAADLRIAVPGARFATAFAGIGLTADSGLSATLARAVGMPRASELLLTGREFRTEEADGWGLFYNVVEPDRLLESASATAASLAQGPTCAYAEIKQALAGAADAGLAAVLEAEAAAQTRLAATADHQQAVADFLAKRTPSFEGR